MDPSLIERLNEALASRYVVKRELARGGMALVFLAEDIRHSRLVAVKVFRPEITGNLGAARFLREIQAAAHLNHPHILALHDSGEADGLLFYVMPYVEGETLRARLDRSSGLSLDEAMGIAWDVADALAYAHGKGLVHRDVKPENILLSSGHAVVMDFGICRALGEAEEEGEAEGLTKAGLLLGTPAYMSPEQWTSPDQVDERSDVYSLGCVVYEMLVGEPPFSGSSARMVMARHAEQELTSPRAVRPDLPEEVEETIRQALAKAPEDRFPSAVAFLEALSLTTTGSTTMGPAGRGIRSRTGRRFELAWFGPVFAATALIGLITFGVLSRPDPIPPEPVGLALAPQRVVVAVLENRTGDPALAEVGRLAADWISEGLHRTGAVDVVPSLTALEAWDFVRAAGAAGPSGTLRALAQEAAAGIVVSGAYYEAGGRLHFQLQITSGETGRLISALEPVEAEPSEPIAAIQALRERVMGALAVALDERLALPEGAEQPPRFEAYRAFSRGLDRYLRNQNRAALQEFATAYDLDPSFVMPLLYSAFCHMNLNEFPQVDSVVAMIRDRRAELSDYHLAWYEYVEARVRVDHDAALVAIRRAAQMAPVSKASYNRAWAAQLANRPRESLEALLVLDPERGPMRGWFPYWQILTHAYHRLGEHEAELTAARRARTLFPEHPMVPAIQVEALAAMGRVRELEALLDTLTATGPQTVPHGSLLARAATELREHGFHDESADFRRRGIAWYEDRVREPDASPSDRGGLAGLLQEDENPVAALRLVEGLASEFPDNRGYRAWTGILAAAAGDLGRAQEVWDWLAGLDRSWTFGFESLQQARILAHLGDRDGAVAMFREALAEGLEVPRHLDYNFWEMRDHPPLVALVTPRD